MGGPDGLSRQADHESGQGDNDNLTLLAPELFQIHALAGVRLKGRGTIKSTEWSESDGLLMFRGEIYVPNDRNLRCRIIKQHHDTCIAGHAGCFKTLELTSRNYWWPQMSHYISIYVKHCNLCNQTKVQRRQPIGELHPSETPEAPWDMISVDFIVKLLESHGYDTIMCVVNSLTKRTHFIPMHTTINVEGTALLFLKEVWKHHGTPQVVVSDRGPHFIATFTHELYKLLGIKLAMSTAYHPQTDRQTEHVNQVLEGYLCIFTS
jgi:transposase InsO family protein